MVRKKESVKGITQEDVYVTINKKELKDFKVLLNYDGPINAPIKKGDEIGEIIIKMSNEEDRIVPLCSKMLRKSIFLKVYLCHLII